MKYFNNEHKKAYHLAIEKSGINDVYHQSLFYTLTIDKDCREHINDLYDFNRNSIKIIKSILMCMIMSTSISKPTLSSIAAFLIAPSIPTQELNLCSLIARSTPKIVSNTTAINKISKNEFPVSNFNVS